MELNSDTQILAIFFNLKIYVRPDSYIMPLTGKKKSPKAIGIIAERPGHMLSAYMMGFYVIHIVL